MGAEPRVALITGASRGIGRALALQLAGPDNAVALVARNPDALDAVADEVRRAGARALPLAVDLGDPQKAEGVVGQVEAGLGAPVSIAVICHASFPRMTKIHGLQADEIEQAMNIDLRGTLLLLKHATRSMMGQRFGRVVLVTSASAQMGQGAAPLYVTVKAGLEGLARNIAIDFGRFGVTANVVAPGFTDTERLRERTDASQREKLAAATSARRLATPDEVAAAIAFLCSEQASYINGITLPVTGGAHLMSPW